MHPQSPYLPLGIIRVLQAPARGRGLLRGRGGVLTFQQACSLRPPWEGDTGMEGTRPQTAAPPWFSVMYSDLNVTCVGFGMCHLPPSTGRRSGGQAPCPSLLVISASRGLGQCLACSMVTYHPAGTALDLLKNINQSGGDTIYMPYNPLLMVGSSVGFVHSELCSHHPHTHVHHVLITPARSLRPHPWPWPPLIHFLPQWLGLFRTLHIRNHTPNSRL